MDDCAWVTSVASVREHAQRGKHRTEVTEATEGELEWGRALGQGWTTSVASGARTRATGKASHRGHGGHKRGEQLPGSGNALLTLTLALTLFRVTSDGQRAP